jgi:hypothetical protein
MVLNRVPSQALPQRLAGTGIQLSQKWRRHSVFLVQMQADHRFEYEEEALDLIEPPGASDIGDHLVQLAKHVSDRLMVKPHRLAGPVGVRNAVEGWVDDFLLSLYVGDQICMEKAEDGVKSVTQSERDRALRVVGDGSHVIEVLAHDGVFADDELLDRRVRRVSRRVVTHRRSPRNAAIARYRSMVVSRQYNGALDAGSVCSRMNAGSPISAPNPV